MRNALSMVRNKKLTKGTKDVTENLTNEECHNLFLCFYCAPSEIMNLCFEANIKKTFSLVYKLRNKIFYLAFDETRKRLSLNVFFYIFQRMNRNLFFSSIRCLISIKVFLLKNIKVILATAQTHTKRKVLPSFNDTN